MNDKYTNNDRVKSYIKNTEPVIIIITIPHPSVNNI